MSLHTVGIKHLPALHRVNIFIVYYQSLSAVCVAVCVFCAICIFVLMNEKQLTLTLVFPVSINQLGVLKAQYLYCSILQRQILLCILCCLLIKPVY